MHLALDMNSEHPNLSIVNRIVDILDAVRLNSDVEYNVGSPGSSPTSSQNRSMVERMRDAFMNKLK